MERYKVGDTMFLRLWTLVDAQSVHLDKEGFVAALQRGAFSVADLVFYPDRWGDLQVEGSEVPLFVPLPGGKES